MKPYFSVWLLGATQKIYSLAKIYCDESDGDYRLDDNLKQYLIDLIESKKATNEIEVSPLDELFYDQLIHKIQVEQCIKKMTFESLTQNAEEFINAGEAVYEDFGLPGFVGRSGTGELAGLNCQEDDCVVPMTLTGIWGYGCWCNFGSNLTEGKYKPVNEYDQACKNMQSCLRCAQMDAYDANISCNVATHPYSAQMTQSIQSQSANESINVSCSSQNTGDSCATHICTCAVQLTNEILALQWNGITYDSQYRHVTNGGTFDPEASCVIDRQPTDSGNPTIECCGKYPFRFVFNSERFDCCEQGDMFAYFNPITQKCCTKG